MYKRGRNWTISYTVNGRQILEATGTSNKRVARKILDLRLAEMLPRSNAPRLEEFSQKFLRSIRHQNTNTKKRYTSSVANLIEHFGDSRLSDINAQRIDEFKEARLAARVRAATVNRDLAVLRRMLRIAETKRFLAYSPFREVEMLEERKERRPPHIMTFAEEEKLLKVAPDIIRALVILILETGLHPGREALALKWQHVDFVNDSIRIRESKTFACIRNVPMSNRCKAELLRWRNLLGPEFSKYVFPNPQRPETHLKDVRRAWPNTLRDAGLPIFWLYDLRYTFATRLTQAGVSPVFIARMMGYSSPNILQTHAIAIDEYRRSAISKLEALRKAQCT
jgi:integrase